MKYGKEVREPKEGEIFLRYRYVHNGEVYEEPCCSFVQATARMLELENAGCFADIRMEKKL